MKVFKFLLVAVLLPVVSFAQKSVGKDVCFMGVDFSCVDIVGVDSTKEGMLAFHDAFDGINVLMSTEADKYDVGEFFRLNVLEIDSKTARERIGLHRGDDFLKNENEELVVEDIISGYPTREGRLLLIVARELDKANTVGRFVVVVFDGVTKEIVSTEELVGNARGGGLRNYWAGALYNSMKPESGVQKFIRRKLLRK